MNGVMSSKPPSLPLEELFRALADPTRLRLLNLIADREICVCYFVGILGISQPKISRHLAFLRRAGVVAARRQGKWMHYRMVTPRDPVAASILRDAMKHLRKKQDFRRDTAKLDTVCCRPGAYKIPEKVPHPALVSIASR